MIDFSTRLHQVFWQLAPADTNVYMVVGDATSGQVGTGKAGY